MKQVTAINGHIFDIDTSEEKCKKFGFLSGENIIDPYDRKGTVVGVAPIPEPGACVAKDEDVLWISLDGFDGKVLFFPNPALALRRVQ